jgi:transcriptional regulator with XRE-family HTH domain
LIAANVKRLRLGPNQDNPKYSVAEFAERLHVGRHAVYDYERPRRGRRHSFTWSELVALCAALECSLFELVLPGEGETVDLPEWVAHGKDIEAPPVDLNLEGVDLHDIDREPEFGLVVVPYPGRDELSRVVFHLPADTIGAIIEGPIARDFDQWLDRFREAEKKVAREAHQILVEALRSALADLEAEGENE